MLFTITLEGVIPVIDGAGIGMGWFITFDAITLSFELPVFSPVTDKFVLVKGAP
jgi:hypothetical protein